jgi:hypothetical protein
MGACDHKTGTTAVLSDGGQAGAQKVQSQLQVGDGQPRRALLLLLLLRRRRGAHQAVQHVLELPARLGLAGG